MSNSETEKYGVLHFVLPVVVLAGGVAGFFGLSALRQTPASTAPKRLPPMVETVTVQADRKEIQFAVDGEAIPYREITLSAEVDGRIQTKAPGCRTGLYVTKGTVLLQIDPRDYDLEVRRLQEMHKQADVSIFELSVEKANAESLIKLAEEELRLQISDLKRVEALFRGRAASDSEYDKSRRDELKARNTLQTLRNQLKLVEARSGRLLRDKERIGAELGKAELSRERTEIVAPIDGVVVEDFVEQDVYVARGTKLLTLEDTSKIEVRFNMRTDQLRWLWRFTGRQQAELTQRSHDLPSRAVTVAYTLDGQEFHWQGTLSRYDGAGMNSATRTVPCIAVVDNPRQVVLAGGAASGGQMAPPSLNRGMFVSVKLAVPVAESLLAIPEAAVRPGNVVWVVRGGKLSVEQIRIAQMVEDKVLLITADSTLKPGDQVITSPLPVAVPGMELRTRSGQPAKALPSATSEKEAGG